MAAPTKVQTMLPKEETPFQDTIDTMMPLVGCAGYGMYSLNIMHPKMFNDIFGAASPRVEDAMWLAADLGLAVCIYRQKCMKKASVPWRAAYSGFGSTLFNLGSNLTMWIVSRSVLPRAPGAVKVLFGLSSAAGLLYVGWHYMTFLNSATTDNEE